MKQIVSFIIWYLHYLKGKSSARFAVILRCYNLTYNLCSFPGRDVLSPTSLAWPPNRIEMAEWIQWDFFPFSPSMFWLARRRQAVGIWLSLFKGGKWYNLSPYQSPAFRCGVHLVNAGKTAPWQLIDISALSCWDIFVFCDIEEKTRKGMEATKNVKRSKNQWAAGMRSVLFPRWSCWVQAPEVWGASGQAPSLPPSPAGSGPEGTLAHPLNNTHRK